MYNANMTEPKPKSDMNFYSLLTILICGNPYRASLEGETVILAFCQKKFRGEDNRPLFLKTIDYCFYCSFYCF